MDEVFLEAVCLIVRFVFGLVFCALLGITFVMLWEASDTIRAKCRWLWKRWRG